MDKRLDYLSGVLAELAGIAQDDTLRQLRAEGAANTIRDFLDDTRYN